LREVTPVAVSPIKVQNTTSETLATGITIWRYGKLRILKLADYVPTTSTFYTLAPEDRPFGSNANNVGRYKDTSNNYYPALITITANGSITASYYVPGTSTARGITNGTVVAVLTWVVS
jgi:hypothetical protein